MSVSICHSLQCCQSTIYIIDKIKIILHNKAKVSFKLNFLIQDRSAVEVWNRSTSLVYLYDIIRTAKPSAATNIVVVRCCKQNIASLTEIYASSVGIFALNGFNRYRGESENSKDKKSSLEIQTNTLVTH